MTSTFLGQPAVVNSASHVILPPPSCGNPDGFRVPAQLHGHPKVKQSKPPLPVGVLYPTIAPCLTFTFDHVESSGRQSYRPKPGERRTDPSGSTGRLSSTAVIFSLASSRHFLQSTGKYSPATYDGIRCGRGAASAESFSQTTRAVSSTSLTVRSQAESTPGMGQAAKDVAGEVDDELSKRPLDLDPAGYFLIYVDAPAREIAAKHFRNSIDAQGRACDPETLKPIPCDGSYKPQAHHEYRARTAKELSVAIIERTPPGKQRPVSMLTHANYLGREFQKAEAVLLAGGLYVQD